MPNSGFERPEIEFFYDVAFAGVQGAGNTVTLYYLQRIALLDVLNPPQTPQTRRSHESCRRTPLPLSRQGLSPERLTAVALEAGRCLPHDRRFAFARSDSAFDPIHPPVHLPKTHFFMLMRDERLAERVTRFDAHM